MANGKNVLLLGCGLVAPPLIHYLDSRGVAVTVASRTLERTQTVLKGLKHATAVEFDIEAKDANAKLEELIPGADVVISLLPYVFHVQAAKVAIKHQKHFCTSSYVSKEMETLDQAAKDAGIILLNECGVDPGLDHMSAKKVIDAVHRKGGKVISFHSITGGLPSPKYDTNPWHYKLSWSPRGVLLASRNNALFLEDGKEVSVPGPTLFDDDVYKVEHINKDIGSLEWYPNRDSVAYRDRYAIPEVQTLIRGTYRYPGWCKLMQKITKYGFISMDDIQAGGKTYAALTRQVLDLGAGDVKQLTAKKLELAVDSQVIKQLEWMGLFSDAKVPDNVSCALDALCHLMQSKLVYEEEETDMICMRHVFEVEYRNAHRETIVSELIDHGLQPKSFSSMARTVSLPLACAVYKILTGDINLVGLHTPVIPELYNPVLEEMAKENIAFHEKVLGPLVWLRSEVKPGEERSALTPTTAGEMVKAGFRVKVERSPHRCFKDEEFKAVGCELVEAGTWPSAPVSAIVLGLKELPDNDDPLPHRHILFAHCYKQQGGWQQVLGKFLRGQGLLWDLEFLVNDKGRRVAAFGRPAGVVGMALGILQWACQQLGQPMGKLSSWSSAEAMCAYIRGKVDEAVKASGKEVPSALVLGALGRCGGGAVWTAEQCGLKTIVKWDLEETKGGGPFPELLQHDILVNAIYLTSKIPAFLTPAMIAQQRKLGVFVDVSCDTSNPNNPFPIYNQGTTLFDPVLRVVDDKKNPLDVIAIDHLPSLLPAEASNGFSSDLLPHLLHLKDANSDPVWVRAEQLYYEKVRSLGPFLSIHQ